MLHFCEGISIFDVGAKIIVNPVNCFGISGAGLALYFKDKYPNNFKIYQEKCFNKELRVGKVLITDIEDVRICNFPTKHFWKNPSKLVYIKNGLNDLLNYLKPGDTIAIPLLGCGKGELEAADVIPLIVQYLDNLQDIEVYLCFYHVNPYAYLL